MLVKIMDTHFFKQVELANVISSRQYLLSDIQQRYFTARYIRTRLKTNSRYFCRRFILHQQSENKFPYIAYIVDPTLCTIRSAGNRALTCARRTVYCESRVH